MRRLLLLRHAKTETDAPSGRDFDRRLDARGVSDADTMGRWIAHLAERPQRVLVSPAMRTQQTWHGVAKALSDTPEVIVVDRIYDASLMDLIRAIRAHGGDASPLLVIGHNPSLHELGNAMTATGESAARHALAAGVPTGGLVTLDFDADDWNGAAIRCGHLVGLVTPKSLRDAAHPAG